MFITALCPSYRRPVLLSNSLQLWIDQKRSGEFDSELLILDDSGIFDGQSSFTEHEEWRSQYQDSWRLVSTRERFYSLPDKYNKMLEFANPATTHFLVWEDDDIYLPEYLNSYALAFSEGCDYVKPDVVLSDYTGELKREQAAGRFHSSLGFSRKLIEDIGGWPKTARADFDQKLIASLEDNTGKKCGQPFEKTSCFFPKYIFAWHTGHPHGQHAMRGPGDVTWYKRSEELHKPPAEHIGKLVPAYDERTKKILQQVALL